jgi:hypothetical protein
MLVSTTKIYLNFAAAIAVVFMITGLSSAAMADEITDWNRIAQQALLNAASSPVVSTRSLAIVQVSVFDAVNGIERRYEPIHADMDAPRGAVAPGSRGSGRLRQFAASASGTVGLSRCTAYRLSERYRIGQSCRDQRIDSSRDRMGTSCRR